MKKLRVDIWSDVMCPFCYIGKRHFEAALSAFPHAGNVEVKWRSFQLDPGMKTDPESTVFEYLAKKKGFSHAQSVDMHRHVTDMAAKAGLEYHFENAVPANSFRAHRLIQLAKETGRDDQLEELLFKAYFTEGKNIDDTAVLQTLADEAGLDKNAGENSALPQYAEAVQEDIGTASELGISGVPFFIFDGKYAVSGAQPVPVFTDALEKAFENWQKNNPDAILLSGEGPSCAPGEDCA
ncbi:MAG: DsbA family oxidoreductase [Mucilaginibacter polytrichastri]|nr:DsbA family oxidoreductase [Mucilaginibacter polytrichastri]